MSSGGKSFHKDDWLKLGLGLGVAAAIPTAFPALFGGATGAAAAGASGAGAGLLGGGTIAGEMAAGAGSGLAGSLMAPSVTPMLTSLSTLPAVGGSSMFGAGQGAAGLSALGLLPSASEQSIWQMLAKGSQRGLKGLETAQKYQKLAQRPEAPPPMGGRPQTGGGGGGGELAALQSLFSNPVGQAQLQRFLKLQGLA